MTSPFEVPGAGTPAADKPAKSPALEALYQKARESHAGFSEKEKAAVLVMREINALGSKLNRPNATVSEIRDELEGLRVMIEMHLQAMLESEEPQTPAFERNSNIQKMAYDLDRADAFDKQ